MLVHAVRGARLAAAGGVAASTSPAAASAGGRLREARHAPVGAALRERPVPLGLLERLEELAHSGSRARAERARSESEEATGSMARQSMSGCARGEDGEPGCCRDAASTAQRMGVHAPSAQEASRRPARLLSVLQVPDRLLDDVAVDAADLVGVAEQEAVIADRVHQAWDPAAVLGDPARSPRGRRARGRARRRPGAGSGCSRGPARARAAGCGSGARCAA